MEDIALRVGYLDMVYQDGFIRYVRLGDMEIIRMINHALRDQNWGTVPMQISDEKIKVEENGFYISYHGSFQQGPVGFELDCRIEGKKDGSLSFIYDGIANKDFLRNRIGFTVLHPIQHCQGNKVTIVHSNGNRRESVFPENISPHQPFLDIREMHWILAEGVDASLLFEGEIFETEDHRNWTDASYKTYCTPLGLPFPVEVKKGDKIRQKVTLKIEVTAGSTYKNTKDLPIKISLLEEVSALPKLGIVLKEREQTAIIKQALQDLSPDYWRIELDLDHDFGPALKLLQDAAETGTPVELCLFSDRKDPVVVLEGLQPYFGTVKSLLLFGDSTKTTPKSWMDALPKLRELLPKAEIYAGTDAFFTELNRKPVNAENLDGVIYSINPQVHAFDDQSLVETLEAQAYTVRTAGNLFPDKKIRVGPVTFHMRWNPNATDPGKKLREPTGWTDKRQFTFFGACWFLISNKYLAESGADAVTYFELSGENGWLKNDGGTILESPIYSLRKELKDFNRLIPSQSSQPLLVDVVCLKGTENTLLLLVNWTGKEQLVSLPDGFQPIRTCQKRDKEGLAWESIESLGNKETYALIPKSLTWFILPIQD